MTKPPRFAAKPRPVTDDMDAYFRKQAILENTHYVANIQRALNQRGFAFTGAERPGITALFQYSDARYATAAPANTLTARLAIVVDVCTLDARVFSFRDFDHHTDKGLPTPIHAEIFGCNLARLGYRAAANKLETTVLEMKQIDVLSGLDRV